MAIKDNELRMNNKKRKRRGSSRYYIFFVLILIALAGLGIGLRSWLSSVSWLNLETVRVSGNSCVADSVIHAMIEPYIGQNLLTLPKDEIESTISNLSRVKGVRVRSRLLNTLLVELEERKGCLYLRSLEGDLFPIDEEGVVLAKYSDVYRENLPVMSILLHNSAIKQGEKLESAPLARVLAVHKKIIKEAPDFLPHISEYYTIDNIVHIIDARDGTRLIPSSENMAKQFSRYEFVQDNGNVSEGAILDLRFENQVVVKAGK